MDRYTQLETQLRNSCPNLTLLQEEPISLAHLLSNWWPRSPHGPP